jgi:hypothetical protein
MIQFFQNFVKLTGLLKSKVGRSKKRSKRSGKQREDSFLENYEKKEAKLLTMTLAFGSIWLLFLTPRIFFSRPCN